MTTNPKVKKFRIRKAAPPSRPPAAPTAAADPVRPDMQGLAGPVDDGFGTAPFPTAEQDMLTEPPMPSAEKELAAIRAEGLTGRQLRMARRIAEKHGIAVQSDADAVRRLRKRGIDPFQNSSILELVVGEAGASAGRSEPVQLPQTVRQAPNLPAAPLPMDDVQRLAEIQRIQSDIVRRRRRKTLMLFARLAAFVLIPTFVAGYYYYAVATPLFATRTEFVIQQAEPAAASGMGSIFRGTQFATTQDAITVQSYLQSRDAMLRLDRDLGFKAHFSQPAIDPLQRLDPDASNEDAFRVYSRNVKISYDPTEGIVKLEVIAADADTSQKFAAALIGYAEEQVDHLTARMRSDQMQGATESFADAEAKVAEAQNTVLDLQVRLGVLDPVSESSAVMAQVATLETEMQQKRLALQQLLDNAAPNQARVDGLTGDIARLEDAIATLRRQLTEGRQNGGSLAEITGQLRIAEADLETRQLMLSTALQSLETSRVEANRQVRYLSIGVPPIAPDEATYPRRVENTVLAFLIFSGIYLMLSLTASILREQVTA